MHTRKKRVPATEKAQQALKERERSRALLEGALHRQIGDHSLATARSSQDTLRSLYFRIPI